LEIRDYNVAAINLDDFHNPSEARSKGENEIESYINNAFNLEFLEKELLKPIQQNKELNKTLKLLDLTTDSYTKEKQYNIESDTIVILEGVLLYREPINKYFDYRVFLDIPFSEVIKRAKKRDVPIYGEDFLKKYHRKYIPLQKRYINEHSPLEKSDLVIDNTDYNQPKIMK
jgi:phosphoglycolate phosphatase